MIASLIFVCSFVRADATSSSLRFDVEKYTLKNGLTVLLYEDHSAPLISYQTWFRVGSRHEKPGTTGIAHLFEHMMFKGAKRYGGKEFDRVLDANGGQNNAFTSRDYTGYFVDLPSAKLELAIDLEADRMENLQVNAENLKSEREVVKEERRFRVDNDVMGSLNEAIYETVYKVHPYRWPVIGWAPDLDRISLEDCRKFFKTYYAPNNAVVALSGDFDKAKAKALIEKYYGKIASQPIPVLETPQEPKQKEERAKIIDKDVQNETVAVVFPAAKAGEPDYYALDLLANILGEGSSSRLYKKLVYQSQLAIDVRASNYSYLDPGVFQVTASLKPGVSRNEVLKLIEAELAKVRSGVPSEKELSKAKSQVMKGYVDGLKTIHGKGEMLIVNEILFNNYDRLFKDLETYENVTGASLKKAAAAYLQPSSRSVVVVRPKKAAK